MPSWQFPRFGLANGTCSAKQLHDGATAARLRYQDHGFFFQCGRRCTAEMAHGAALCSATRTTNSTSAPSCRNHQSMTTGPRPVVHNPYNHHFHERQSEHHSSAPAELDSISEHAMGQHSFTAHTQPRERSKSLQAHEKLRNARNSACQELNDTRPVQSSKHHAACRCDPLLAGK